MGPWQNINDLSILDAIVKYNPLDPLSVKRSVKSYHKSLNEESNQSFKIAVTEDLDLPCSSEIKEMTGNTSRLISSLGHEVDNSYPSMQEAEESFQILRAYMFSTYSFLLSDHRNIEKLYGIYKKEKKT